MKQSHLDSELRSKIDAFVEELSLTVKRAALESVHAALSEAAGPGRRASMKVRVGGPAAGPLGKRTSEQVTAIADRIASYVRSHPGARLEQIASGLGTASKELKLPVIKLLGAKTLTKKGQKRGTMYFAGTRHAK
jgi:hypothetical protein